MRRIRNKTDETLTVPQLGVTLAPGQEADVPEELQFVAFSDLHFDETNDGAQVPAAERRRRGIDVTNISATDTGTTDEGAK
jgi:hypothetical protein